MSRTDKMPSLSVVVPVYNGEAYLSHTLDSIRRATYKELEIILIDDGSGDGSGRICREYAQADERIRYIKTQNHGIAAARNRGMDAAKGKYICFCDQDDEVEERMYTVLIEKMQEQKAQIGICSTGRMIGGRKSLYESMADGCCRGDEILERILYPLLFRGYDYPFYRKDNYLYGTVWKCVFRRDFLEGHKVRFKSFVDYEDDWLFVTEALCHAGTVATASHVGYYWRVDEKSRSHRKRFIPGIEDRYGRLDAYVMDYLGRRIKDEEILGQYRSIRFCEHYVDAFRNEPEEEEGRRAYYREVRAYLKASDYKKQLSCRSRLDRHAYRRRLISGSLLGIGVRGTFLMNRFLSAGEEAAQRMQWLVQLERNKKIKDSRRIQFEADHSDSML